MHSTSLKSEPMGGTSDTDTKKGASYRDAELTNLKLEIITDSLLTEFIYKTFILN